MKHSTPKFRILEYGGYNINMNRFIRIIITLCILLLSSKSWAILHLVLTQGIDSAIPIAVVPFSQPSPAPQTNVSAVIGTDLSNSGQFKLLTEDDSTHQPHQANAVQMKYWRKQNVNYLIVGNVKTDTKGRYTIQFSLLNVFKHQQRGANPSALKQVPVLMSESFNNVEDVNLRQLAHHMSDLIYQKILGQAGVFSTKIAYVLLQKKQGKAPIYKLIIADYDGFNPRPILISHQPIMSPAWSPNGQEIAYVSFEDGLPAIYISNITTGKRQLITQFPGINGAPAFSPNGQQLAVVLSKGHQPNIYVIDLANGHLQQVTKGYAIDTEPAWSADGKSLLFTSDRSGSPQIYQVNLNNDKISRVSFDGSYNAHASFSPDGQNIVLLHRGDDTKHKFGIALQNVKTGQMRILSADDDQSPSFAPNGSMVIYARQDKQGQGELAMMSSDGRVRLFLPSGNGDVREPVWSPFLGDKN